MEYEKENKTEQQNGHFQSIFKSWWAVKIESNPDKLSLKVNKHTCGGFILKINSLLNWILKIIYN